MSKTFMPLWRGAHSQVKSVKGRWPRTILDVQMNTSTNTSLLEDLWMPRAIFRSSANFLKKLLPAWLFRLGP